jgi:hypothetical protein
MPKYLDDIDLAQNHLLNAALPALASPPSNPVEGQIYYDTTQHAIGVYSGSAWIYGTGLVTSVFSRTGAVVATSGDYTVSEVTGAAPLTSPALTGTPTAPTASGGNNTTLIATTAFVTTAVATETSRAETAETAKAPLAGATFTGYLAPAVVTLTDASTIAVNAALGNDFRVTLGGSRTMGAPSNPVDGQDITFMITQPASGGPDTVTWTSGTGGYSFGASSAPTLSTGASATDMVGFKYRATAQKWLYMGSLLGY